MMSTTLRSSSAGNAYSSTALEPPMTLICSRTASQQAFVHVDAYAAAVLYQPH
jgi:hypothetical protein